jgi:hypothetical protein
MFFWDTVCRLQVDDLADDDLDGLLTALGEGKSLELE